MNAIQITLASVLTLAVVVGGVMITNDAASSDESREPVIQVSFDGPPPAVDEAQRQKDLLFVQTLERLPHLKLDSSPKLAAKVKAVMERNRGTDIFLQLVERYEMRQYKDQLMTLALENPAKTIGVNAAKLLLKFGYTDEVREKLLSKDPETAGKMSTALGYSSDKEAFRLLAELVRLGKYPRHSRQIAVSAFGLTSYGERWLLSMVERGIVPGELKAAAGRVLHASIDPSIRQTAAELLPRPATKAAKPLPPIAELVERRGDPQRGRVMFTKAGCVKCHVVGEEGIDFGPNLSEIGSKLSREAMYVAILDPSAGIEHNYEPIQIETELGDIAIGLVISETDDVLTLKIVGGIVQKYKKSDIFQRKKLSMSLMPSNLQTGMNEQELVDLVEFLMTLKKPEAGDEK